MVLTMNKAIKKSRISAANKIIKQARHASVGRVWAHGAFYENDKQCLCTGHYGVILNDVLDIDHADCENKQFDMHRTISDTLKNAPTDELTVSLNECKNAKLNFKRSSVYQQRKQRTPIVQIGDGYFNADYVELCLKVLGVRSADLRNHLPKATVHKVEVLSGSVVYHLTLENELGLAFICGIRTGKASENVTQYTDIKKEESAA